MDQQRKKPYGVSVGSDEHYRLKILATEDRCSMTALINNLINELWDQRQRQQKEKKSNAYQTTR